MSSPQDSLHGTISRAARALSCPTDSPFAQRFTRYLAKLDGELGQQLVAEAGYVPTADGLRQGHSMPMDPVERAQELATNPYCWLDLVPSLGESDFERIANDPSLLPSARKQLLRDAQRAELFVHWNYFVNGANGAGGLVALADNTAGVTTAGQMGAFTGDSIHRAQTSLKQQWIAGKLWASPLPGTLRNDGGTAQGPAFELSAAERLLLISRHRLDTSWNASPRAVTSELARTHAAAADFEREPFHWGFGRAGFVRHREEDLRLFPASVSGTYSEYPGAGQSRYYATRLLLGEQLLDQDPDSFVPFFGDFDLGYDPDWAKRLPRAQRSEFSLDELRDDQGIARRSAEQLAHPVDLEGPALAG